MREVYKNLFCGNQWDWLTVCDRSTGQPVQGWAVVHAAKEPFHRQIVGYTTRGAPKDHPEYLWAVRGNRLALNMVDAPSPEFFDPAMIDKALEFIESKLSDGYKVLVHCNQGESRAPSICLLYLVKQGVIHGANLDECITEFKKIYPLYNPGSGLRAFLANVVH